MKRLTKKRAEIILAYLIPLLESNLMETDGDLYSAYQNHSAEELQAAIDAMATICQRQLGGKSTPSQTKS
jgi:hypothetical protein